MAGLLEQDLLSRSLSTGREIALELRYGSNDGAEVPVVLMEQMGEGDHVKAIPSSLGSYMCHTHLSEHPPSSTDYLVMLKTATTHNCIEHRVITPKRVYSYSCSTGLNKELRGLLRCDAILLLTDRFDSIKCSIVTINDSFKLDDDISLYVRNLKDLGINLSVRTNDLEASNLFFFRPGYKSTQDRPKV